VGIRRRLVAAPESAFFVQDMNDRSCAGRAYLDSDVPPRDVLSAAGVDHGQ
jgi:hypothetical protein